MFTKILSRQEANLKQCNDFNFLVNFALALQCSTSAHYDIKRSELKKIT